MKSGLRGDPDAHWNLILPQIICYIVVLKVLKLPIECSPNYLCLTAALSLLWTERTTRRTFLSGFLDGYFNETMWESRDSMTVLHRHHLTVSCYSNGFTISDHKRCVIRRVYHDAGQCCTEYMIHNECCVEKLAVKSSSNFGPFHFFGAKDYQTNLFFQLDLINYPKIRNWFNNFLSS